MKIYAKNFLVSPLCVSNLFICKMLSLCWVPQHNLLCTHLFLNFTVILDTGSSIYKYIIKFLEFSQSITIYAF